MRRLQVRGALAIFTLFVLTFSAFAFVIVHPSQAQSTSPTETASTLLDNFTQDTSLNTSLWQINGTVGYVFGLDECTSICTTLLLNPTFSSAGMEVDQANQRFEVGTIQSIESFTPPFTLTAVVNGTVSNGHTFTFGIASTNASSGVLIYGDLNPHNCSNENDCGNPATCGTPANSSIESNQCYYGIDRRIAQGGGLWDSKAILFPTPSVNVVYTLQISVDDSGNAKYSVSQGTQVLGSLASQVGIGPFYVIIGQSEGAPVETGHTLPNVAYWMSVSLGPLTITPSTTSTSTSPSPTPSGILIVWLVIVVIIVLLLLIILLWYRRRGLTVTVLDSRTQSPVSGASVSAYGPTDDPKSLSGNTKINGRIVFGGVKEGDYSIKASAVEYKPSVPATVRVTKKTDYTVKLDRIGPSGQAGMGLGGPSEAPRPPMQEPQTEVIQPVQQGPAPAMTRPESAPFQSDQKGQSEMEGWGGERIHQIVKTFQMKGAISPETALTAEELGLSRLFVRIMKRRRGKTRVFIEINGRYYLDQRALQEMS